MKKISCVAIVLALLVPFCAFAATGGGVFSSRALGFSFWYPITLSELDTYDESGDMDLQTGTGDSVFVSIRDYSHVSDGLGDWQFPKKISQMTPARLCAAITNFIKPSTPYLPVYFAKNSKCNAFKKGAMTILYGIGYEQKSENPPSLGSMIIVLRKNDAVIFSNLLPDIAKLDAKNKKLVDTYVKKHNNPVFGSKGYNAFTTYMETILKSELQTKKVKNDYLLLKKIANSIKSL